MPEAVSPEIQWMVARFGGAAVAAGLMTPAIADSREQNGPSIPLKKRGENSL